MSADTTTTDPALQELRDQVSAADRSIVDLVNRRLELVRKIWVRKNELGLEVVDPQREARMLDDLEQANRGPLTREGLRDLHAYLLVLTKREVDR